MAIKKLIVNDINEAISSGIDSNRLVSLSKRGDANPLILESIGKLEQSILDLNFTGAIASIMQKANAITEAVLGKVSELLNAGLFGTDMSLLDLVNVAMEGYDSALSFIQEQLGTLAGLADIFSIDKLIDGLIAMGVAAGEFIIGLFPDFIQDLLKNFDIGKMLGNFADNLMDKAEEYIFGKLGNLLEKILPEWWWNDKERKLYNYTLLSLIPTSLSLWFARSGKFGKVGAISMAVNRHRRKVNVTNRTIRI